MNMGCFGGMLSNQKKQSVLASLLCDIHHDIVFWILFSGSSNQPISPILQFSSLKLDAEGRTFMIGRQGRLECVYSG